MACATDQAIIDYARQEKRFCVTLDADFHSIIAVSYQSTPSVIRIRQQGLSGQALAVFLIRVYLDIKTDLANGCFVTITDKNIRVRCLPIG